MQIQIEDINQDIKDVTNDYLINTSTPDTNILDNTDDTIKYIKDISVRCRSVDKVIISNVFNILLDVFYLNLHCLQV